jgi:chromosomal replication initiation ATPase DnaA
MGQGHRDDFYKLKDQRFLGPDEFVDDVHHRVKEEPSLVYELPIEEIVSAVEYTLGIAKYIFYSFTRSRQGAWGRAVVAFLGKKWGGYQLKRFAEHFKRDPVVMSKGVSGVEKKLTEDRAFARSVERMEKILIQNKRPKIVN